MKVALLGTGAYGMALSSVLSDNNIEVEMWTKFEDEKDNLVKNRKNEKLLPGFVLSETTNVITNLEKCIKNKDVIIIAIPVPFIEELCIELSGYIEKNQHLLIVSKGIEREKGLFVHELVRNNISTDNIAILSGPSFAKDVIEKKPFGLTLASNNQKTIDLIRKIFENNYIKIEITNDIVGVEVCSALKNVFAIASGILGGLDVTDSTKATFLTECIMETKKIIDIYGGSKETILTFAGLGDLLLTCTTLNSRNYTFGYNVGKGLSLDKIKEYVEEVTVEGYNTLLSLKKIFEKKNVDIKIINIIDDIINKGNSPKILLTFIAEK